MRPLHRHIQPHTRGGFHRARAITRRGAKTFYFASRFLTPAQAAAAYAIYAVCRASDASVDRGSGRAAHIRLQKISQDIKQAYSGERLRRPLLAAFRQTVRTYGIAPQLFDRLLSGMAMDLNHTPYPTYLQLQRYCYRVAGVVGQIMLRILDPGNTRAEPYAIRLGIAMQMTNIIRDVGEDLRLGRVYLPQEDLEQFHVSESLLSAGIPSPAICDLLRFQIRRARALYRAAEPGIALIRPFRSRLVVRTMSTLYARILHAVERHNYDVFSQRAYVPWPEKIALVPALFTATVFGCPRAQTPCSAAPRADQIRSNF
ncbi:MAG: phytoene/squalene synthase family protein [Candidatus Omnitrophica bacterium]|nr:phytoene/squalene synthase family protein [Candidatus Omnitrophota bacterium]